MKRKIKRIQAVCILYDVIIIVAFATNSNGKKYRKIQNTFPVQVIHKTGDDKENFVIVIMGDWLYRRSAGSVFWKMPPKRRVEC